MKHCHVHIKPLNIIFLAVLEAGSQHHTCGVLKKYVLICNVAWTHKISFRYKALQETCTSFDSKSILNLEIFDTIKVLSYFSPCHTSAYRFLFPYLLFLLQCCQLMDLLSFLLMIMTSTDAGIAFAKEINIHEPLWFAFALWNYWNSHPSLIDVQHVLWSLLWM